MVPYEFGSLTSTVLKQFLPGYQFKTYKVPPQAVQCSAVQCSAAPVFRPSVTL
jgi:hypothetical protein